MNSLEIIHGQHISAEKLLQIIRTQFKTETLEIQEKYRYIAENSGASELVEDLARSEIRSGSNFPAVFDTIDIAYILIDIEKPMNPVSEYIEDLNGIMGSMYGYQEYEKAVIEDLQIKLNKYGNVGLFYNDNYDFYFGIRNNNSVFSITSNEFKDIPKFNDFYQIEYNKLKQKYQLDGPEEIFILAPPTPSGVLG